MGEIKVPYHVCDFPGCGVEWPASAKNGNLEVIFGVHPKIAEGMIGPVILQEETHNFCPNHAEQVKRPMEAIADLLGGVVGPDFLKEMGCWITMWHWHGGLVKQVLNHKFPYDMFTTIYTAYRRKFFCVKK